MLAKNGRLHSGELRPIWVQYLVSFLGLAAALGILQLLEPILGPRYEFVVLYPAIAFAAYYGGLGPALLMLVLGGLAVDYLFLEPRYAIGLSNREQIIACAFYALNSLVIAILGSRMRRGRFGGPSKSYECELGQLHL